ncbi:hypothetical protein SCP_0905450 [Sparassis crispa]|uniref:Serine/threonine-protein kinase Tel1 n=1 Tax=Sparassis crispa TaxID=139825 RepID=A0A401GWR6_9APHY|nr:hypothetical protein SCP_0905450 [Sparassis crispa]GBE86665.1 hypothetical protein SCP_0905450 [Sparassis crispa]
MSYRSVRETVQLIRSDKVKVRQEGISTLRDGYENGSLVSDVNKTSDGRGWTVLFQACFEAVEKEFQACAKKGGLSAETTGHGAAALGRLKDVTTALRELIQHGVETMNNRALRPLLRHLRQRMLYRGELLAPVALTYIKAIGCVFKCRQHLEHLEHAEWVDITQLAFNVVLRDRLNEELSEVDGQQLGEKETTASPAGGDEHSMQDAEEGTPSTSTADLSRKRRRSPSQKSARACSHDESPAPQKPLQSLAPSAEQIEFMTVLVPLLQSPFAPLLSQKYPGIAAAVLNRLERFIDKYPTDTSLHHNFVLCLSAILSHVALNHRDLVSRFARKAWPGLVAMWNSKDQTLKEDLIVVLKVLFPFLTDDQADMGSMGGDQFSSVTKLWRLLNGEGEIRWKVHGLSLDSLRLEVVPLDQDQGAIGAITAHTFRHGWHFDATQAFTWAILELQAECTKELFLMTESMPLTQSSSSKRSRLEDPITSLLSSVRTQATASTRIYYIQVLLFFVDRHWSILHAELKQEVSSTLLQFVSVEDGLVQSWTFLCLAAIAHAGCTSDPPLASATVAPSQTTDSFSWDSIWAHAMRRLSVPAVCRAASHAAHVLLVHGKRLLTSQRILSEVEALAADLDVQGPLFPYDSVCAFLVLCLRVVSQDVRLYRMQLEEKALTWLTNVWRVEKGHRLKMSLHTTGDVLMLMESICALSRKSNLVYRMMLPECSMVEAMVDDRRTVVIRDFLLHARLPPFRRPSEHSSGVLFSQADAGTGEGGLGDGLPTEALDMRDLNPPRGRERRLSAFLLRSLEELVSRWEASKNPSGNMTAEKVRSSLDLSVLALCFEASLVLNGTRSNRRVIQAACKLVSIVAPLMTHGQWSASERALAISGLQPLILAQDDDSDFANWETLLPPSFGTGIRRSVLKSLTPAQQSQDQQHSASRRILQRVIFQSTDVQDVFVSVLSVLRDVLRLSIGLASGDDLHLNAMDIDKKDGFGPVRTPEGAGHGAAVGGISVNEHSVDVCITTLAVVPILQSASGEPTRDKELTDLILGCENDDFTFLASSYVRNIQQGTLNLSPSHFHRLLTKSGELLMDYRYARNERFQSLVIRLLDATASIWIQPSVAAGKTGDCIRSLYEFFSRALLTGKIPSWRVRDHLACCLIDYLRQDPTQTVFAGPLMDEDEDWGPQNYPLAVLPTLGADEDIRVRFRAAVINAHLFAIAQINGQKPEDLYTSIKGYLCRTLEDYEHMLTRLLCLGNIMIVSSAIRRGPYWHLLEACLYTSAYTRHIEAVLVGVGERMGLPRFSTLFESYASQIAYSIRESEKDFLVFPPHLLGYQDRRECAEATFHAFTPTNLLGPGTRSSIQHGYNLFSNHCKAIQKSTAEGVRECFAEIVGYQIVIWIAEDPSRINAQPDELEAILKVRTKHINDEAQFMQSLAENADAIVAAILRTLGDPEYSKVDRISDALRTFGHTVDAAQTFQKMVQYREEGDFEPHEPNLPWYGVETVLQALTWFSSRVPEASAPAITYHVLHQLFADLERSPIVNEQMRLLNAICLWVASHSSHFEDYALLRTVINGATTILIQSDLAHAAQSILAWCFGLALESNEKDPRLPDIFIRISRLAYDYSHDRQDTTVARMGHELMQWMENEASRLCRSKAIKPQIVKALSAWPQELPRNLRSLCEDVKSSELSSVLNDYRISPSKFRLVRRLRDLAAEGRCLPGNFPKSDFWRLKECIPSAAQLLDDDIDAFATLLLCHHGHIDSFVSEQSVSQTVRTRHRYGVRRKDNPDPRDVARRAIVDSLLNMLGVASATQVYTSYRTLRSLMSVCTPEALADSSWPSEHSVELRFLRVHCTPVVAKSQCDLGDRLVSERALEISRNFSEWITYITTTLCEALAPVDLFYAPLTSILQSDPTFAEQILPLLVHTALQFERSQAMLRASSSYREILSRYFTAILAYDHTSVPCLRAVVDIVLHLRFFTPPGDSDALAYDTWLDTDYTLLSRSAIKYGAYTTALLFLELEAEHREGPPNDTTAVEDVLFDIYSHIDEPDGFYGIPTQDLHRFLIRRLHHEKQWDKAFRFHGAALEAGTSDTSHTEGIIKTLHSFGFNSLAMNTLGRSLTSMNDRSNSNAMTYHLGWRTETWDLPEHSSERNSGAPLYMALRAIHRERNHTVTDSVVRNALVDEMMQLHGLGAENFMDIRQITQNIMCLHQVKQWRSSAFQAALQCKSIDVAEWAAFTVIDSDFEFSVIEEIMATRISLIRSVRQKEQREQIGDLLSPFCRSLIDFEAACLIRLSEAAREAHQTQIALNSVTQALELLKKPTLEANQEYASVLWLINEPKIAVQALANLLSEVQLPDAVPERIRTATLLARLGTWSAEANLGIPTDIIARYFDPATALLSQCDSGVLKNHDANYAAIYHQYAVFAERQYHSIVTSPDALRWRVYVDRKTAEIQSRKDQLRRTQTNTKEYEELKQEQRRAQKVLQQDQTQFSDHIRSRDSFLGVAVDMYSRCLESSDSFDDDSVIRLCSLWLANFDNTDSKLGFGVALDRIPSRKFVVLAHQLSARLAMPESARPSQNQEALQMLLTRMCREHPFHSLFQVFCLLGERTTDSSGSSRRQSGRHESVSTQVERATAAADIFNRLRSDTSIADRVRGVEEICRASLQWAKYPIKEQFAKKPKSISQIPNDLLIRKIHNLHVPVITVHTPVDPTAQYQDCIWINYFDQTFTTAGGVNLPKITTCIGTDGQKYKQLFKGEGNDDLRQDAVMEQVFDLVNVVLRHDRETVKRKLSVRGYKVIPLAAQAGVLEFVDNTTPLGSWLMPAHKQYRPTDMSQKDAQSAMNKKRTQCNGEAGPLLELFLQIRERFKPVMRYYFTERHKTPMAWFSMRLSYSRSVATTSVVGHILGLGDRHTSNILMDNVTGEVIHIDLGIAFDQGKLLGIPERVPFRLTPDMVDGLGITGTQGVFQRCAEETLRVLRDRSDVILTVLEVFRYDPLHSWTASELKIQRVQGSAKEAVQLTDEAFRYAIGIDLASGTADEAADRALQSVNRKLDKTLSVECAVNELTAEATDTTNLATMYSGWGPFL